VTLRGARAWVREQAALLVVIAGLAAGFGYLVLESGRWGRATGVIAVVVLLAGVLRLVLPTGRVGALAVRSRAMDTVTCLVLGGLLLALDLRLHS
jgi:Protein of unknown function (DUF3017)